eukprot:scaffold285097_cov22-Tisochrysis_lutea.AAC.1
MHSKTFWQQTWPPERPLEQVLKCTAPARKGTQATVTGPFEAKEGTTLPPFILFNAKEGTTLQAFILFNAKEPYCGHCIKRVEPCKQ